MMDLGFILNQGYHVEYYEGPVDTDLRRGEAEREEEWRANEIEFACQERFREEKRQCKNKEWYY